MPAERLAALNNVEKKGNNGISHREMYVRGRKALEEDALMKLVEKRDEERVARAKERSKAQKEATATLDGDDDGENDTQDDEDDEEASQEASKKRAAPVEGEGDATLESTPVNKKARTERAGRPPRRMARSLLLLSLRARKLLKRLST